MSFDIERFDNDNQQRLRELITGVSIGSIEQLDDALELQVPLPFIGSLYAGGSSPDGRLAAGIKDQRILVEPSFVIIAESFHSREHGRDAALALIRQVKNALVTKGAARGEWQNPQAEGPFIYDRDSFLARSASRVAYEVNFHCWVTDNFNA